MNKLIKKYWNLIFPPKIYILGEWEDDLSGWPSECTLRLFYRGRYYIIYARWRWSDPWSVDLVECPEGSIFGLNEFDGKWTEIIKKTDDFKHEDYYKDTELPQLKIHSLLKVKEYFDRLSGAKSIIIRVPKQNI